MHPYCTGGMLRVRRAFSSVSLMQSQSAKQLSKDQLALHFFYLNVGQRRTSLIWHELIFQPGWRKIRTHDGYFACNIGRSMPGDGRARSYPYLLHRAHETAVVKLPEKEQVTTMIAQELRERGSAGRSDLSSKQSRQTT